MTRPIVREEQLAGATWLASGLLALVIRGPGSESEKLGWKLVARQGERDRELSARALRIDSDAGAGWLVSVGLPNDLPPDSIGRLAWEDANGKRVLAPAEISTVLCSPSDFARTHLSGVDHSRRGHVLEFLASACRHHGLTPTPELAARLVAMRDLVRTRYPLTEIKAGTRHAVRLERVVAIDERSFWLTGWIHDPVPTEARIEFLSPEGIQVSPDSAAITFHPRPDVDKTFGELDVNPNSGFHALVELSEPSDSQDGWVMVVRTVDGDEIEDAARTPVDRSEEARQQAIGMLVAADGGELTVLRQALPALSRISTSEKCEVDEVVDYGHLPADPSFSLVIPLRAIDRVEHQLVEFARDPDLARTQLIFVLPPVLEAAVDRRAPDWLELFRVPFRIVKLTAPGSFARSVNRGSGAATGRLLMIMRGDVIPSQPGWLTRLSELHDATPSVGAVGPRLLHSDGSIANAGIRFVPGRESATWERDIPLRGYSASLPACAGPRRVQALSDACMMLRTDCFREIGGMSEDYVDGGGHGAELSLRLAEAGLESWVGDVDAWWLERQSSWPGLHSLATARVNDLLLTQRWGPAIAAMAQRSDAAGAPASPAAQLNFPLVGSDRAGAPVEILDVMVIEPRHDGHLLDASLLRPRRGEEVDAYANTYGFAVQGWVIADGGGALKVEVRDGQRTLRHTSAQLRRDDVMAKHPALPGAQRAGFQMVVGTLGLRRRFELQVDAVSDDGLRTTIASIAGRRRTLRSSYAPSLQPTLITTLGRTGSSWLALLLSRHPEVVAYRPFQNEARVASYWMEALRAMAEPSSYIQAIRPELYQGHWWIGDERPSPLPLQLAEPHMPQWLGSENVEVLAGFCQSRIDAFYSELARVQEPEQPRYFAEKCWPDEVTPRLMAELYPDGRELLLVRDFRDMVCSIIGFNAKRGFASFGRELTHSDEEFIRFLRGSALQMLSSWSENKHRAHLIRYEDLILDPGATLETMFSYLGIRNDAATVDEVIKSATALLPHVQRAHQTSTSVAESVGRWKTELSPEHKAICEEAFGDVLNAFGYEPTPTEASAASRSPESVGL